MSVRTVKTKHVQAMKQYLSFSRMQSCNLFILTIILQLLSMKACTE